MSRSTPSGPAGVRAPGGGLDTQPRSVALLEVGVGADELPGTARERLWLVVLRDGVPHGAVETTRERALADARAVPVGAAPLPAVADEALPRATVVVSTIFTRLSELERCLAHLEKLDYPLVDLVLVDNRRAVPDDDPAPALLRAHPQVRLVRAPRPGISAARNAGVAAARGELVAFTDDDVQVDPRWLRALAARLVAQPRLDAVTGLVLPAELETAAQLSFERYYGGFASTRTFDRLTLSRVHAHLPGRATVLVSAQDGTRRRVPLYGVGAFGAGANMAFRRSALERIGGFDPALGIGTPSTGGEDLAALMSLLWDGGQVGYEPAAFVHHRHRPDEEGLQAQMRGYGLGYTAALTALVAHDPRHLAGIAVHGVPALAAMVGRTAGRLRPHPADDATPRSVQPRSLVTLELSGGPLGPVAYVRSRRALRHAVPPR